MFEVGVSSFVAALACALESGEAKECQFSRSAINQCTITVQFGFHYITYGNFLDRLLGDISIGRLNGDDLKQRKGCGFEELKLHGDCFWLVDC